MNIIENKKLELKTLTKLWLSEDRESHIDYLIKENKELSYILDLAKKTDAQIEECIKIRLNEKEDLLSYRAVINKNLNITITQCGIYVHEFLFKDKELAKNFTKKLNNKGIWDKEDLEDFIEMTKI